jgi:hypothetical protein
LFFERMLRPPEQAQVGLHPDYTVDFWGDVENTNIIIKSTARKEAIVVDFDAATLILKWHKQNFKSACRETRTDSFPPLVESSSLCSIDRIVLHSYWAPLQELGNNILYRSPQLTAVFWTKLIASKWSV